jgi:excisionase family DNA binding protein
MTPDAGAGRRPAADRVDSGRPPKASRTYLRAREAAAYLGLATQTLARWRCEAPPGRVIPFYRVGRAVLYDRDELDLFVNSRACRHTSEYPPRTHDRRASE